MPPPAIQTATPFASYRSVVAAIYLLVILAAALSIHLSIKEIDADIANVARERGSVLFRLIELTRDWGAGHGGVYVPITEKTQPNPYLKHPKRDITDNHGRALTLVNPAFMTRQIAEIAEKAEGVRFHITSLKPIRPANEADAWEAESLGLFEKTALKDRLAYFADGGGILPGPAHRYMAPLLVKPACMKCHEFQGYQVGEIRGGISITMPADALVELTQQRRKQVMALYLAGFILIAGLGHLVAWRTHHHLLLLQDINRQQEVVIAERTHDLSEAEKEQLIAAAVFGNAAEAVMVTDRNNRILRVNPAFTAITGYTPVEVVGNDPGILKSGRHDAEFFKEMWHHLDTLGRWEGEIWNKRKNGEVFVAWLAITTITGEAGEGRHVATFIDVTKRKEAEEIILHRANFDVLTDLPNRGLFDDRLVSILAMARRHRRNFALMYIDLDWFKNVNDSFGHAAGDSLLAEAAKRMEKCVRDADTVARLGGDEFAVILSDLNGPAEVEEVARRVNRALAEPFELAEGTARVSGSIGIAIFPGDGADELLLKKAADKALYASKAAGRNTYRLAAACQS
jgi:diguanylate cyclase (GGDEF)-like protein/PAS domain S-box-containing protein